MAEPPVVVEMVGVGDLHRGGLEDGLVEHLQGLPVVVVGTRPLHYILGVVEEGLDLLDLVLELLIDHRLLLSLLRVHIENIYSIQPDPILTNLHLWMGHPL